MRAVKKIVGALAVSLLLILPLSLKADQVQDEAAVAASKAWLVLVDSGKYGESWDQAADYFRKALSKEKWESALKAVRQPLGKVLSRELTAKKFTTSLPGAPDGQYVVIQYKTSFENKKDAVETVTPFRSGGLSDQRGLPLPACLEVKPYSALPSAVYAPP